MNTILSSVAHAGNLSRNQYPPRAGREKKKHKEEDRLLALQKELDRITFLLRRTGDSEAIDLARRMEDCGNGARVYDHPHFAPHIRLEKPCSEPACPICRDKRQRRAYASSLPAFDLLLGQDPHLKFSMITLTAPPLYGDLPAFRNRVARFLKVMNFRGTVRGIHMTCGQDGPQAHCHVIAFYHGDPPTEAECYAAWGGQVDVTTKDSSAETAAAMYAYLYKGHQPSRGEDVSKLPLVSKLIKGRVRVSKAGEAVKRAFLEAKSQRAVFLSKGFLFSPDSVAIDPVHSLRDQESIALGNLYEQEFDSLRGDEFQCRKDLQQHPHLDPITEGRFTWCDSTPSQVFGGNLQKSTERPVQATFRPAMHPSSHTSSGLLPESWKAQILNRGLWPWRSCWRRANAIIVDPLTKGSEAETKPSQASSSRKDNRIEGYGRRHRDHESRDERGNGETDLTTPRENSRGAGAQEPWRFSY